MLAWGAFIVLAVMLNRWLPLAFQCNLPTWTYSTEKALYWSLFGYAGLFLVVPLALTKGWGIVRQPAFLLPPTTPAITLRTFMPPAPALAVAVLTYLHRRFDVSELGFRSRGWRGDLAAILTLGLVQLVPPLLSPGPRTFTLGSALLVSLDRLFANPASTAENLFYFGFLAEGLSKKTGSLWTPVLIRLMYTAHEMTNPEYWYEGQSFVWVFLGVAIMCAVYLWRRNIIAVWLGDCLGRFLRSPF